mmetsp:Transcript_16524/g.37937  ORF Transcript_16524/g.37937 Transcript_16524/m.37937 type:complete len:196 (-) Transcript_16524:130-717(-)
MGSKGETRDRGYDDALRSVAPRKECLKIAHVYRGSKTLQLQEPRGQMGTNALSFVISCPNKSIPTFLVFCCRVRLSTCELQKGKRRDDISWQDFYRSGRRGSVSCYRQRLVALKIAGSVVVSCALVDVTVDGERLDRSTSTVAPQSIIFFAPALVGWNTSAHAPLDPTTKKQQRHFKLLCLSSWAFRNIAVHVVS